MSVIEIVLLLFMLFVVDAYGQSTFQKCDPIDDLQCDDGSCVKKLEWCDTSLHCPDGSDEIYCDGAVPCRKDIHFECENRRCIPVAAICDSYDDCYDGSDEKNCNGSYWLRNDSSFAYYFRTLKPNVGTTVVTDFSSVDKAVIDKAADYFLTRMDADNGWGAFTPRAVVALSLASRVSPIAAKNKELMLKHLNVFVLQGLMAHKNTLSNLALYVNALHATCEDPRNFQGMDLVARLRSETDRAKVSNTSIPLPYLTLCLSNSTKFNDNFVLANMYNSEEFGKRTGSRALIMLAMTCIMRKDQTAIFQEYMSNFFNHEIKKAVIEDIYTQALVMQASIAAEFSYSVELSSRQLPDGSFGDMLSTYYSIPVLLNSSLLDLVCRNRSKRSIVDNFLNGATGSDEVSVALWITSGKDVIARSTTIKFDGKKSFYDIMTMAASRDPLYKFHYDESDEGKKVYSIADIPNDIESGKAWFLYVGDASNVKVNSLEGLQVVDLGIDQVFPVDQDQFIFWLKNST